MSLIPALSISLLIAPFTAWKAAQKPNGFNKTKVLVFLDASTAQSLELWSYLDTDRCKLPCQSCFHVDSFSSPRFIESLLRRSQKLLFAFGEVKNCAFRSTTTWIWATQHLLQPYCPTMIDSKHPVDEANHTFASPALSVRTQIISARHLS